MAGAIPGGYGREFNRDFQTRLNNAGASKRTDVTPSQQIATPKAGSGKVKRRKDGTPVRIPKKTREGMANLMHGHIEGQELNARRIKSSDQDSADNFLKRLTGETDA